MRALLIDPVDTVSELDLPEPDAHSGIRDRVGATRVVDQGLYHPQALLHVHGNGQTIGLDSNLTAWALASAWRGMPLYSFHGPVVVTGRDQHGETTSALDDELAARVHAVAQTVRETREV
ncbi:hypothetical protein [Streptomyces griseiscabiei]|uniref:Uncharacterized protein n=1 Tax=Streptomyces griseiscabiei TaxID=2993540 RepID=A0ABU4LKP5_9ACTN|nr:hypothetical protein [Streptomyces griseiscabiei]MBZ3906555.1 hypothetical protein [Streptomyces griseiscabiei]MDX2916153.1 hypothetical protein [Streptomyces griseiscabiei]